MIDELADSARDMWCITPQEVGVESFTDADADSLAETYRIAAEEVGADPWNDALPMDHPDKIVPPIGFVKGGKAWIEVVAEPVTQRSLWLTKYGRALNKQTPNPTNPPTVVGLGKIQTRLFIECKTKLLTKTKSK